MATTIDEIADLFLSGVQDYKITTIFTTSGSDAVNTYVEPWLLKSISEFTVCDQALVYDKTTQSFSVDLTQRNQNILTQIMEKYWLKKEIQNVLQMNLFIQDKDFKTHSAAQNLKEKTELLVTVQESISQTLMDYSINYTIDWDDWNNQIFR
jgi:hypothetical protein